MHARGVMWLLGLGLAAPAAADVVAEQPSELSVTVYRAPHRNSGSINLNDLEGFALVSEKRTVNLPAGLSLLKFEGVADGIEPVSAIVTGLPRGVIEKNDLRDTSPKSWLLHHRASGRIGVSRFRRARILSSCNNSNDRRSSTGSAGPH